MGDLGYCDFAVKYAVLILAELGGKKFIEVFDCIGTGYANYDEPVRCGGTYGSNSVV